MLYSDILKFLIAYGGESYRQASKCKTKKDSDRMVRIKEKGQESFDAIKNIASIIAEKNGLFLTKASQWQISGNVARYYWCQLKKDEVKQSSISISLFADELDGDWGFRVSVELDEKHATQEDWNNYKRLLDIELKAQLVYIAGGNNQQDFSILPEQDNLLVKKQNLAKVQVSYIVKDSLKKTDDEIEKELDFATQTLMEYYNYVFSSTQNPQTIPKDISTGDTINLISDYVASKGFSFAKLQIQNLYLCLKSKPFVILAGISGTGKTRLVRLFAEAIDAEYFLVPVRPDWSDGSDLFGHFDFNGKFVVGPVFEAFQAAQKRPDKPVILCLDEMNLARVEYYLSDILSLIESREKKDDGKIRTSGFGEPLRSVKEYSDGIPENLYIVGTVNMDETTFPFSKKVLDRANTIEFNTVELQPDFSINSSAANVTPVTNGFLKTEYLVLAKDCAGEEEFVSGICDKLQAINDILAKSNLHVGYRVRDEIVFYMLNNKKAGQLLTEDQAFDYEIMQKILPRIQGSAASLKDMLVALFKLCMGSASALNEDGNDLGKQMVKMASSAKYPKSAAKIAYMMTRYEEDGFTAFWI